MYGYSKPFGSKAQRSDVMKKLIYFNDRNKDKIIFARDLLFKGDNFEDRSRMKKVISKAMNEELTDKQRTCILAYYVEGKKMKYIAEEMGVVPSTVTRHIRNGIDRIMNIAKYYV